MTLKMPKKVEKDLRNKHYGVFNHSAVQICGWTKKSLKDEGDCYKKKFYGADCHRCMEFSPAASWCENNCVFCWRPMEEMRSKSLRRGEVDDPKDIYENLLKERYKLINGFPGNEKVNMEKYRESLIPSHFAISLSGEPTMYPKLPDLIRFLKSLEQTKTVFLVTNAQEPDMLERLSKENSLPTQLYVSVNAPDRKLFDRINCPAKKTAWKTFLRSLDIASKMKTRKIMRMTMIKGMNTDESLIPEYAKLIERLNPHFIEVKAYMHIGYSRKRLKKENMPYHKDIAEYAKKLSKAVDFDVIDEQKESRIVLLENNKDKIGRMITKV